MIKNKPLKGVFLGLLTFFLFATPAFAHVVVKPSLVGVASFQTFTMGVPNEKDSPTVAIRLMIPQGLQYVSPNVKPGWTISVKRNEIDWTGGSIPPGQRDDFYFNAQVPPTETTLKWDVYQVYKDGETVAWTHDPTTNPEDDSAPPPHSVTKVINDLATPTKTMESEQNTQLPLILSIAALALSALAFAISLRKKERG